MASWRPSGIVNGTPGSADPGTPVLPTIYVNEVLTKTVPVTSDAVELFNPDPSPANIGGWYLSDGFNNPKKYRIPDGTTIPGNGYVVFYETNSFGVGPNAFGFSAKGESAYLFSAEPGGNLTGYFHGFDFGAQAAGVTFGRYVISTGEEEFPAQTFPTLGGPNSGPKVGPIVISEINYHPVDFQFPKKTVDNSIDEYIELQNISSSPAPLYDPLYPTNTWHLRNAVNFDFPAGVVIPPGGFILVVSFTPTNGPGLDAFRAANNVPSGVPIYGPWDGALANSEASIELARPDQPDPPSSSSAGFVAHVLADKVHYQNQAPWPIGGPDGLGASIQRINPSGYGNDPANWRGAVKTPGGPLPTGTTPPTITAQPLDIIGIETYAVSFSITAAGSPPLGYQWLFNGQPIRGAAGAVLTLPALRLNQAGHYACLVLNAAGSVLSSNAALTIRQLARIQQQPADLRLRGSTNSADYGFTTNNATFSIAATGTGILHYQWRVNGTSISGATGPSVIIPNVGLANEGSYDVVITDDVAPVLSLPARLTVLVTPTYLLAPLNQVIASNGTFTVGAVIRGNPPPYRYEWREVSTVRASTLTSDTTNFFTSGPITNRLPTITNTWRLIIFNDATPAQGAPASFSVVALADADGDGIPDDWENQYGLNPNNNADGGLDSDGDGMSNYAEYLAGTDPTNRLSNLRLDLTARPDGVFVRVGALANHTYSVQYRDFLSGSWMKLGDIVAQPTNHMEMLLDRASTTNRFYRLVSPRQN
jgi:hypothetical protein